MASSSSPIPEYTTPSQNLRLNFDLSKYDHEFHLLLTCLKHSRVARAFEATSPVCTSYFNHAMHSLEFDPKAEVMVFKHVDREEQIVTKFYNWKYRQLNSNPLMNICLLW